MSVTVAIPARYASTRLPGKLLADLCGKPVLAHVIGRIQQVASVAESVVVCDHEAIAQVAQQCGARFVMSDPACPSGTARIASVLDQLRGDLVINVQGDEPFIRPEDIERLIARWRQTEAACLTPVFELKTQRDLEDPACVKVVRSEDGRALYFSRSPLPHMRGVPVEDWLAHYQYWGHMGVYGYRRDILERFTSLPEVSIEMVEQLEQLRLLGADISIDTMEVAGATLAIDTPEDLERARAQMLAGH